MPIAILLSLLVVFLPCLGHAASMDVTLTLNPSEVAMVQFFATREGKATDQVLRHMCEAGIASFRGQYIRLTDEGRSGVFKQMTPQDRASVCAIFLQYGSACPAEEP